MTSADALERWGRAHITGSRFLGVFPMDRLLPPGEVVPPAVCVVNYDPAKMPGSHWVAVSVQPSSVSWFDSYGLGPDSSDLVIGYQTHFWAWLSHVCQQLGLNRYEYNRADLQSPSETTCGHWAVYFAKNGPKTGWEVFGPDREKNDRLIRRLVRIDVGAGLHRAAASM